jgi:hypothetical protein
LGHILKQSSLSRQREKIKKEFWGAMISRSVKEQKRSNGQFTRPLFIKHLELDYWQMIEEIMNTQFDNPREATMADVIRFALKRSTGRA